jgi:hypothetical protein
VEEANIKFYTSQGYDDLFARIKAEGFDGVETPISLVEDKAAFGVTCTY